MEVASVLRRTWSLKGLVPALGHPRVTLALLALGHAILALGFLVLGYVRLDLEVLALGHAVRVLGFLALGHAILAFEALKPALEVRWVVERPGM